MWKALLTGAIGVACLASGCGSSISEVRTLQLPPREETCSLEFIQADATVMSPGGPWEVVGQVIVGGMGSADPFSEEHRAAVRPRACKMGGEAIAILTSATTSAALATGSTTIYAVLRKRPPPGDTTPQKF